jgi:hypothetical protein
MGDMMNFQAIYEDGSGAPAMVTVEGWTFALDYLGEVKCRLVTVSASRKPPKWAASWAQNTYRIALQDKVSAEWFEKNHAMYAEEAS